MKNNKQHQKWPLPAAIIIAVISITMAVKPSLLPEAISWLLTMSFFGIMLLAVIPHKKPWHKSETAVFLHELNLAYLSGGAAVSLFGQMIFWMIVEKQLTGWLIGLSAITILLIIIALSVGRYQRDGQFIPGYALGIGISGLLISNLTFAWPAIAAQAVIIAVLKAKK